MEIQSFIEGYEQNSYVVTQALKIAVRLRQTTDLIDALADVMEEIRSICSAKRCCVLITDTGKENCSVLCEAHEEGIRPVDEALSEGYYKSPANLELFPLKNRKGILGYVRITGFDPQKTDCIRQILEIVSVIISSEITDYNMYKELERVSRTDLLTGVNNRNAMNNRITEIVSKNRGLCEHFGVVFADLNGLKTANDSKGHQAGDVLLQDAAALLSQTFTEYEIYRAGGDEFLVIAVDIDRDDFDLRVEKIKGCDEVSFAVGTYYADTPFDIRRAMHLADKMMYADKQAYYEKHPDEARR